MQTLTLVTGNTGKYKQISSVLEAGGFLVTQKSVELIEIQSNDMLLVSSHKAMQAFQICKTPIVVDDSGIYFTAYPQFPGVWSKYIYKSLGMDGLQKLFHEQPDTHAYFQCVLSYMDDTLDEPIQFIGRVDGEISFVDLASIEVDAHLPYDAIFHAHGMNTVAQRDMQTFQTMHHRIKACQSLVAYLAGKF